VSLQLDALRKTKPSEYALRFFIGGCVTVATGLIAMKWGRSWEDSFLPFLRFFPQVRPSSRNMRERAVAKGGRRKERVAVERLGLMPPAPRSEASACSFLRCWFGACSPRLAIQRS